MGKCENEKENNMIPFKEYFRVLLEGRPEQFLEDYFFSKKPYRERYKEFDKQLKALYESDLPLTEEMQEVLDEIDDVESGYGNVDDI